MTKNELVGTGQILLACAIWGFAPILYKCFNHLDLYEMLFYRAAFTFLFAVLAISTKGGVHLSVRSMLNIKSLAYSAWTSVVIACDWFLYIWSIINERAVEATIGCFLSPVICIMLGSIFFSETLSKNKTYAVILSLAGAMFLVNGMTEMPWLALMVAVTTSLISTMRKLNPSECLQSVTIESMFILIIFLAIYYKRGEHVPIFIIEKRDMSLIWLTGLVTFVPAYFYSRGAKLVKVSVLGVAGLFRPIIRFLVVTTILGESVVANQMISILFIFLSFCCFFYDYAPSIKVHPLLNSAQLFIIKRFKNSSLVKGTSRGW